MNRMMFDIASRHIEYAVAWTIANMLDAGQSTEDSPEKKFWHQEILMAIKENVDRGAPESFL